MLQRPSVLRRHQDVLAQIGQGSVEETDRHGDEDIRIPFPSRRLRPPQSSSLSRGERLRGADDIPLVPEPTARGDGGYRSDASASDEIVEPPSYVTGSTSSSSTTTT
jgi:hypothetical protein